MTLNKAIRLLMRHCPIERVVIVAMVDRISHWADCQIAQGAFKIRLSTTLDRASLIETLAHEWAHAMVWRRSKIDHGSAWGEAYARCYRVLIDGWRPAR